MKRIKIGKKYISDKEAVFIIAEAGINHNGDLSSAKALIDAAACAGADAIKFQTHFPEDEMLPDIATAGYVGESLCQLLERTKLTKDEHKKLKRYAEDKNLLFLSTPFSKEAADFLEDLGVVAFKIGSGELTNIPFLIHIAKKARPMIISTGMSSLNEVRESVNAVKKYNRQIILLQCTSIYPTPYNQVNLGALGALRKEFACSIGLSDHSIGIYTALGAIALGACLVEKHFTISRSWPGPDQKSSIEPEELRQLVIGARAIREAMGNSKRVFHEEKEVQRMARESVVATKFISKDCKIRNDMVWVKRPGTGIPAKYLQKIIGKIAKRDIKKDTLICWKDLK